MNGRIECPLEKVLREAGFVQMYDGQSAMAVRQQKTPLPPEERRFFVRHYQQARNGRFINKWAKLVYDMRNRRCVTLYFTSRELGKEVERQKMVSFDDSLSELQLTGADV